MTAYDELERLGLKRLVDSATGRSIVLPAGICAGTFELDNSAAGNDADHAKGKRLNGFSPKRRLLAAMSLLLHLFMVGAAPLAEARAEAGSDWAVHIEAEGKVCSPGHDHSTCQFCRILGGDLPVPTSTTGPGGTVSTIPSQGFDARTAPRTTLFAHLLGPRAPPQS